MGKAYAVLCYLVFLGVVLWAVFFIEWGGLDAGRPASAGQAAAVDAALIALFAVQHSVMARAWFKARWLKSGERSTYVLVSSLLMALLFWQWRPLPGVLWQVQGGAALALRTLSFAGWVLVVGSTFLLDHFELFGLRQAFVKDAAPAAPAFRTPLVYRYVRHPLYLGFLIAFWAAPLMTVGHLLFALGMTGYVLIGIGLEERDLLRAFGATYRDYQTRVGMLLPFRRR